MKNVVTLLSTYKSVHLNKHNQITHFIGVPMIMWSIALLLSAIEFQVDFEGSVTTYSLLPIAAVLLFGYYLLIHLTICVLSIILLSPILYSASLFHHHEHFYVLVIGFFVLGWFFQFLGHYFEKAKPAFIDDLKQLFIGPFFLVAEIYFFCGFGKSLENTINTEAKNIRKNL